jgi:hypothetical protein
MLPVTVFAKGMFVIKRVINSINFEAISGTKEHPTRFVFASGTFWILAACFRNNLLKVCSACLMRDGEEIAYRLQLNSTLTTSKSLC